MYNPSNKVHRIKEPIKESAIYLVDCLGILLVTIYLITEFFEEGSLTALLSHLANETKLFYHFATFLTIPTFMIIGHFYRKQRKLSKNLEVIVDQRTNQLKKAQDQLIKSERLSAIGEASTMIAHDLRNPLQGISNSVYYLKRNMSSKMSVKEEKMVQFIEKDIKWSEKILEDLLDYSKELVLNLSEVNLQKTINEALSLVSAPESVHIENLIHPEQKIDVDPDRIVRVFVNIIENAVEAMPEGGKILISEKESAEIMQITISDNGKGMTEPVLKNVGKPFYTTKAKGLGLGVSIAKRIVEAHKGMLSFESNVGTGTSVTITLPINSEIRQNEAFTISSVTELEILTNQ